MSEKIRAVIDEGGLEPLETSPQSSNTGRDQQPSTQRYSDAHIKASSDMVELVARARQLARDNPNLKGWRVCDSHFFAWLSEHMGPENVEYLRLIVSNANTIAREASHHAERVEALKAVRAYYFLANPTKLTETQVCDMVCWTLGKIEGDAVCAMPTVVTGEQPLQSVGDHALPPSGLSPCGSQALPAAAIARKGAA